MRRARFALKPVIARAPSPVVWQPLLNTSRLRFIQRFTDAIPNDGWIVVYLKRHGALKAVRPRDEHAKPAFERVSGDPGFGGADRVHRRARRSKAKRL
jgi:hypothetical protein